MIGIILILSTSYFGQRRSEDGPFTPLDKTLDGRNDNNKPPAPVITGTEYQALKSDASELAILSRKVSDQLNANPAWLVVSVQTLKDVEQVEKLAKKLRNELTKK
jgi:hypothetical protein